MKPTTKNKLKERNGKPIARPQTPRTLVHPRRKRHRRRRPALRFRPTAWAKLLYLRDKGPTEVGGFGTSAPDDLLLVDEVRLVRQHATATTVAFDDAAVADFFDEQIDAGRRPEQFARIWIHTHPGDSPLPSPTDEETFARVFGPSDWAVMAILARGGRRYARLRFNAGPGGTRRLPVRIDYEQPFPGTDEAAWDREYEECVEPVPIDPACDLDEPWFADLESLQAPATAAESDLFL